MRAVQVSGLPARVRPMSRVICLAAAIFAGWTTATSAEETGPAPAQGTSQVRGVFPAYGEWTVPVAERWQGRMVHDARQQFKAEAVEADERITGAIWRVEGPEQHEGRGVLVREWGRASSEYELRARTPGDYSVVCRFTQMDGKGPSVSWSVTVSDDTWATLGRRGVDPSEPGRMTFIEGGTFLMGAPAASAQGGQDAVPAHEVQVDDFYIGTYLVTAGEFCAFLNERGNPDFRYLITDEEWNRERAREPGGLGYEGCNIYLDGEAREYRPRPNRANCPANQVTWFGAVQYCRWLSEHTGETYRLPTEAEWEYAARGPEGRRYPWGSEGPFPGGRGATAEPAAEYTGALSEPAAPSLFPGVTVGSFPKGDTPEGVTDLTSGMGQWCTDVYSPDYYSVSPRDNPTGPVVPTGRREGSSDQGVLRVMRGEGVGYHTNYNDVTLWPLVPENYYYMSPAWTRGGATDLATEQNAGRTFQISQQGFRVARELDAAEVKARSAPEDGMEALR